MSAHRVAARPPAVGGPLAGLRSRNSSESPMRGPPKVAYLVNQYPMVSHTFIRREIHALERQGFDVLRFALRGWDSELADPEDGHERGRTRYVLRGGLAPLLVAAGAQAARSPRRFCAALRLAFEMGRRSGRSLLFHLAYLAEACWLAPRLAAAGVAHLHAHFGTNSADVAMLVSVLGGLPYSFTVHGAGELDRAESIGLSEKIRRSALVVAISSFGRGQLYRCVEHAHWRKVKVVHCGLDRAFRDAPPVPIPDRARLVCLGRLCAEKGQYLLLEATAALARAGTDVELVLVGDGELRAGIEAAIARLQLGRRVRITGWLSGAAVRDEIQAARALVLPSFYEGLPVAIMEAMALGRPVLTTYVAGIPELVVHGEHGWLFPVGSVEELAAAMKECLEAPVERLVRMGSRARERALARHDADCEAARLAALFRSAAARRTEVGSA